MQSEHKHNVYTYAKINHKALFMNHSFGMNVFINYNVITTEHLMNEWMNELMKSQCFLIYQSVKKMYIHQKKCSLNVVKLVVFADYIC